MSIENYESGGAVVASALAGHLGSDPMFLSQGKYDMRRLSVLREEDLRFFLYAKIRSRKSRAWRTIYDELLNLKTSIGGRGRRDIIRMEQVSHGGMSDVNAEINSVRPGWIGRNITRRNWQEEAELEGKI